MSLLNKQHLGMMATEFGVAAECSKQLAFARKVNGLYARDYARKVVKGKFVCKCALVGRDI